MKPKNVGQATDTSDLFSGFPDNTVKEEPAGHAELSGNFSTIHTTPHTYRLVETENELYELNTLPVHSNRSVSTLKQRVSTR